MSGRLPFPVPLLPVLAGAHLDAAKENILLAAKEAASRATCLRSACGAVVSDRYGNVMATGYNSLPSGDAPTECAKACGALGPGFKSDRTCCTHAEVRAIVNALRVGDVHGGTVTFTRINAFGDPVPSGRPYCTICSKLALEVGLSWFVLAHDFGVVAYPTALYNQLSFSYGHEPQASS